MATLKVVVAGAGGRMGSANIRAIAAQKELELSGALDRAGSPAVGRDAGLVAGLEALNVAITDDVETALDGAEAIVDFSAPQASVMLAQRAAKGGLIHVIGTTGCTPADDEKFAEAGRAGARIVKAGNFSLGLNVLMSLVEQAARKLAEYDIEIVEMHHNRKVDAPSGTALMLGEAAARGRNVKLAEHSVRVRDGHTGPREAGSIGFASLRGGTVVGEHSVVLAGPSERIEFVHHAEDRSLFANGAVKALLWARTQRPGFYSMADVLGL